MNPKKDPWCEMKWKPAWASVKAIGACLRSGWNDRGNIADVDGTSVRLICMSVKRLKVAFMQCLMLGWFFWPHARGTLLSCKFLGKKFFDKSLLLPDRWHDSGTAVWTSGAALRDSHFGFRVVTTQKQLKESGRTAEAGNAAWRSDKEKSPLITGSSN